MYCGEARLLSGIILFILLVSGCGTAATRSAQSPAGTATSVSTAGAETLPALSPVELGGRKLRVVATTNLVGDAVAQVGDGHIELTTLLAPGTDPHAYQLAPADRQQLEDADVIFANGLGLEEGMLPVLDELG